MTKPARNPDEIEKIKEEILDKALEIIIESGTGSMTMRSIASRCGMSATNLYNYFTNKEEIYLAILVKGYRILHAELTAVCEKQSDPLERGRALIKSYLAFGSDKPHYYDIMFSRPSPRYEDYVGTPLERLASVERDLTGKIIGITRDTVEKVLARGSGCTIDIEPETTMVHLWCLLHGMVVLRNNRIIDYIAKKPDRAYDRLIQELFRLILG